MGVNVTVYAPGVLENNDTTPVPLLIVKPAGAE
jgi:hypothetical protein